MSDDVVEQRILEQSMRLTDTGAVTGWAALRLAGAAYFDGLESDNATRLPVPLAAGQPSAQRSASGAVVSTEPLALEETREIRGIRCTRPVRALFDEVRRLGDPRAGAVAIDMTVTARLVAIWQLSEYLTTRRAWRRSRVVDGALMLADEWSRSPAESRLRLIWVLDAGLPSPLCNRPVFDLEGRLLGKPDLLDVEAGVIGEYDGAVHLKMSRRGKDLAREEKFRRCGLEYFAVVGSDMHDVDVVVERMRSTRERALERNLTRGWTITPPPGWEAELSFGDEQRFRQWEHERES